MRGIVLFLLAGAGFAGEVEERLAALEKRVAGIDERLAGLDAFLRDRAFEADRHQDLNGVRYIVVMSMGNWQFDKEGRIEVFGPLLRIDDHAWMLGCVKSTRFGYGPTLQQVRQRDYSKFPYDRFKRVAGIDHKRVPVPLVWDKKPDAKGGRIVGLSSGVVKWYRETQVQTMLRRFRQVPAAQRRPATAAQYERAKITDLNGARNIVGLLVVGGKIRFDEARRIDIFLLFRKGEVKFKPDHLAVFGSARFGYGPAEAEIKKNDYSNFPYERFRSDGKPILGRAAQVPLIWDKQPDLKGGRLVGWSSGAVKWYPEARIQEMLKRFKQLPPNPPR